jgi:hypothetical protein
MGRNAWWAVVSMHGADDGEMHDLHPDRLSRACHSAILAICPVRCLDVAIEWDTNPSFEQLVSGTSTQHCQVA